MGDARGKQLAQSIHHLQFGCCQNEGRWEKKEESSQFGCIPHRRCCYETNWDRLAKREGNESAKQLDDKLVHHLPENQELKRELHKEERAIVTVKRQEFLLFFPFLTRSPIFFSESSCGMPAWINYWLIYTCNCLPAVPSFCISWFHSSFPFCLFYSLCFFQFVSVPFPELC